MRQFFRCSALPGLFFGTISFFLLLAFAAVLQISRDQSPFVDILSKNSLFISVEEEASGGKFTNDSLLSFVEQNPEITLICEKYINNCAEVYINNSKELNRVFDIYKGERLTDNDIKNGGKTAVISENITARCYEENGVKYIFHQNDYYRVTGVFEKGSRGFFVPLVSVLKSCGDETASGQYYFDAGENTREVYNNFKEYVGAIDPAVRVSSSEVFPSGLGINLFAEVRNLLVLMAGVIFLLLLNIFSIVPYWLNGKKREIFVRRLCGATKQQTVKALLNNFFVIIICSMSAGGVIALIFINLGFMNLKLNFNNISEILIPLLITAVILCVGVLTSGMGIAKALNRQLAEIER